MMKIKKQPKGKGSKFIRILNKNRDLIESRKKSELSEGEKKIAKCLHVLGLEYEREYYMKGMYNPVTDCPLFFDFYIMKLRMAIEFDGPHHFKPVYGEVEFEEQQAKDKIKNKFCASKNIWILRIPFWEKDIKGKIVKFLELYYRRIK